MLSKHVQLHEQEDLPQGEAAQNGSVEQLHEKSEEALEIAFSTIQNDPNCLLVDESSADETSSECQVYQQTTGEQETFSEKSSFELRQLNAGRQLKTAVQPLPELISPSSSFESAQSGENALEKDERENLCVLTRSHEQHSLGSEAEEEEFTLQQQSFSSSAQDNGQGPAGEEDFKEPSYLNQAEIDHIEWVKGLAKESSIEARHPIDVVVVVKEDHSSRASSSDFNNPHEICSPKEFVIDKPARPPPPSRQHTLAQTSKEVDLTEAELKHIKRIQPEADESSFDQFNDFVNSQVEETMKAVMQSTERVNSEKEHSSIISSADLALEDKICKPPPGRPPPPHRQSTIAATRADQLSSSFGPTFQPSPPPFASKEDKYQQNSSNDSQNLSINEKVIEEPEMASSPQRSDPIFTQEELEHIERIRRLAEESSFEQTEVYDTSLSPTIGEENKVDDEEEL
uniref:Uncharacterized protein n=1 Tax=Ditylenchus dipsaci TaxID=166011 RepID=A0A915CTY2_9BILA